MVKNSDKKYGELMLQARNVTDRMEIGEATPGLFKAFKDKIDEAVQEQYEKNPIKNFYIHLWATKEPYSNNNIHIHCHNRITRPSPYQGQDHYLYSVTNYCKVDFEWCIPNKETLAFILKNPHKFNVEYVRLLKKYVNDTLEKTSDYILDKESYDKYNLSKKIEYIA
jgi:hypothetical protein